MRDYQDLRRVYNLTLTQAFFALLEQKVLDVWETLARMGYGKNDWFDFTEKRWKALPVERQIQYSSEYQKWYAERLGVGVEQSFEGSVFRLIPPGKFTMGSLKSEVAFWVNEKRKNIRIKAPLWVGRYPVTQFEYKRVIGENPSTFRMENYPVETITWDEGEAYCTKIGYQLLSDREWEYACRAGTTTLYSFGDDRNLLDEYGWYEENSEDGTESVGQKKSNSWGLQDVHGNVWEWTTGLWNLNSSSGVHSRIIRGGSWDSLARLCRSASSGFPLQDQYSSRIGFRVCKAI